MGEDEFKMPDPSRAAWSEPTAEARAVAKSVRDLHDALMEQGYPYPLALQLAMAIILHG